MALPTFKSAGVNFQEIDNTAPSGISPTGVPAAVIGTANRGPAFVPVTFATFQDFVTVFGNTDGKKFGPYAVKEWLKNAGSVTYLRVLGTGDGKTRSTSGVNAGRVNNAGFIVGDQQVQVNGLIGRNTYNGAVATNAPGSLGRTYFLSALMSESNGSTYLSTPGIQTGPTSVPILRGILMAPSGVILSLSSSVSGVNNNTPAANTLSYLAFGAAGSGNAGANIGTVKYTSANPEFVLLLNGLKNTYKNVITASFDPKQQGYFANVLNTDPTKIESTGHYLYAHYDIDPVYAVVTGTGYGVATADSATVSRGLYAMLLTSSLGRNSGSASTTTAVGVPNFEGFEDRYSNAFTPYIVSQKFGGIPYDLFRFHALDDGASAQNSFKITISDIVAPTNPLIYKYGTFTVQVRNFLDSDRDGIPPIETFSGINLDPTSPQFIGKVIGDFRSYYDFDQPVGKQRLIVDGSYVNKSKYVRVELSEDLKNNAIDPTALPTGFRGIYHLVTSGTSVAGAGSILTGSIVSEDAAKLAGPSVLAAIPPKVLQSVVQPPLQFRESISDGTGNQKKIFSGLTWGVQFELKDSISEPNQNNSIDVSVVSFGKFLPTYHTQFQNPFIGANQGTADVGGAVLDADRFNKNFFSLEQIEIVTSSLADIPDPDQWPVAAYRRNGVLSGSINDLNGNSRATRFIDPVKDFSDQATTKYLKFTVPFVGGFDGVNIFNKDKANLTNDAAVREMIDTTNQFGVSGPTVGSYRKAVDVLKNKTDAQIQLLAIPGLRDPGVTNYAIDAVERRFDALYIMDVEHVDKNGLLITGTADIPTANPTEVARRFQSRGLDSSFAAAYYPDVTVFDSNKKINVSCPPSVAVIGAFSLNDAVAFPWFAPAGFTRGALSSVVGLTPSINQKSIDSLSGVKINSIAKFQGQPNPVVFDQKTLLASQSSLDRINVRRLLIEIRRRVRQIANTFIFEPNVPATIASFNAAVTPVIAQIQQQQGLDRFSVRIDTTTTTQSDIENNTIRGKIYLQPTKTAEFISVDLVLNNAGANIQ